jgi:Polycystin cation channel
MSVIMWIATLVIAGLRVVNVARLSRFDPADQVNGADAFGSDFAQLHGIGMRIRIERNFIAFLSFLVWLRVFKYTRSIPVFGTIGRTMMRAFPAVRRCLRSASRWSAPPEHLVAPCQCEDTQCPMYLRLDLTSSMVCCNLDQAVPRVQIVMHIAMSTVVLWPRAALVDPADTLFMGMQIATYIAMSTVISSAFSQSL